VHKADAVVSNADAAWTYLNLIPAHQRPRNSDRRIKSKSYSMSLFVIYFGTKRQYRDAGLAHHNIMMHPDYTGLLRDIFRNKDLTKDFSLYLPDLQANIVAEHRIAPRHFAGTLNSYLGSAFSIQPALTQSAWFRPHNRSEDVENLYFVGAGTHIPAQASPVSSPRQRSSTASSAIP